MSVMIRGEDRTRLRVMGDVEAELPVPAEGAGRCWLSFSDGTLIEAAYGADDDCRFAVSEEGADSARARWRRAAARLAGGMGDGGGGR